MSAFNKVMHIVQTKPINGHAARNIANRLSLAKANEDFKILLKGLK